MQKYLVGTKAIIIFRKKILLLQRSQTAPTYPLHWDLPGGLIDLSDDPNTAVDREVFEETGLKVDGLQICGVTKFMRKDDPTIVLIYKVQCSDNEKFKIILSDEHVDFCWVEFKELQNMQIQPWLKEYLLNYGSI